MALVQFNRNAAGPTFGPYEVGDVVDLAAGDITKLITAHPNAVTTLHPAVVADRNLKGQKHGDNVP